MMYLFVQANTANTACAVSINFYQTGIYGKHMRYIPAQSHFSHIVQREIFEGLNFRRFRGLEFYTKCSLIRITCYHAKLKAVSPRTLCNEMVFRGQSTKYKCLENFALYGT